MIAFEQRLSDSTAVNARIAKKYSVLGWSPVMVMDGASTGVLSPWEHQLGSSDWDASESDSSDVVSTDSEPCERFP